MKIVIQGITGRMGQKMAEILKDKGHTLAAGICIEGPLYALKDYTGEADLVIDFSHHSGTVPLLEEWPAAEAPRCHRHHWPHAGGKGGHRGGGPGNPRVLLL